MFIKNQLHRASAVTSAACQAIPQPGITPGWYQFQCPGQMPWLQGTWQQHEWNKRQQNCWHSTPQHHAGPSAHVHHRAQINLTHTWWPLQSVSQQGLMAAAANRVQPLGHDTEADISSSRETCTGWLGNCTAWW